MYNDILSVYNSATIRFKRRLSKREISEGLNVDYIHDAVEQIIKNPKGFIESKNKLRYMLAMARNIRSKHFNTDVSKSKPTYESFISSYSCYPVVSVSEDGREMTPPEITLEESKDFSQGGEEDVINQMMIKDIGEWLLEPEKEYHEFTTILNGKKVLSRVKVATGGKKALMMSMMGYSRDNIKEELGVNERTVKSLLTRGRSELRKKYGELS